MRFRASLASRVALLATVAVGLAMTFVAAAAYLTVRHQLFASMDSSLLHRASAAARTPALERLTENDVPSWVLGAADVRIAVLTSDNRVISLRRAPDEAAIQLSDDELSVARGTTERSLRTVATEGGRFRVAAVQGNQPGSALVLAQSLDSTYDALRKLSVVLVLFGLSGVVAAGFAGSAVARNGLSPVRRLTEAVEEIARTERLEPIAVDGNDEIARLAAAFNAMVVALSASWDRQRQLVADAGHELRTPLTSLRTNLDLLSQADARGGLPDDLRAELMSDVIFQIDELTTLIGDLTELARVEPIPVNMEPVDLAEVAERAVDRVRRRAAGVRLEARLSPWWVTGESSSLERAVTNLLDNAAKWSPAGGTVHVVLEQGILQVADEGPGIAPADLPHVFERFYRSSAARTLPGSGLGLSIVARVAERHNGWVRAGNDPDGGAVFWLGLPGTPDEHPGLAQGPLSHDSATQGKVGA